MENKAAKRNYKSCNTLGKIAGLYNCDCGVILRQLEAYPSVYNIYMIQTQNNKLKSQCLLSHSLIDSIFTALGEV
jgi:hypothetical protein